MTTNVVIKGIRDGLHIILPPGPMDQAIDALMDKLDQNRAFFEGGDCPIYISGELSDEVLNGLQEMLATRFGIRRVERSTPRRQAEAEQMGMETATSPGLAGGREGLSLAVEGMIRNGQRITYQGDVIILGDCNPGSSIVAGGSVYVMGALRGVVHAGALGDETMSVSAFTLLPTQIRIASFIARAPEGAKKPDAPQIARVKDGHIQITNVSVKGLGGLR